uniref:Uncharacterized protein n=1 Tax=Oryza brachyantha TaxID=4533 RepID=J3MQP2_ORYBR
MSYQGRQPLDTAIQQADRTGGKREEKGTTLQAYPQSSPLHSDSTVASWRLLLDRLNSSRRACRMHITPQPCAEMRGTPFLVIYKKRNVPTAMCIGLPLEDLRLARGKESKMDALVVVSELQIAELGGTCAVAAVRIRMGALQSGSLSLSFQFSPSRPKRTCPNSQQWVLPCTCPHRLAQPHQIRRAGPRSPWLEIEIGGVLCVIDAVSPFFGQTQRGPVGSSSFFLVYKRSEPLHLSPAITIVLHNSCSILARCVVSHHAIQSIKNAHDMLAKKETER